MLASLPGASITPHSQACPAPLGESPTGAALWPWDTSDRVGLAVPAQGSCSPYPAALRLCHGQCHVTCVPFVAAPAPFLARAEAAAAHGRDPQPLLLALQAMGTAGATGAGPLAPAVEPCPPRRRPLRAGWSRLQHFIICKTSLGSTPSNLGSFLIAGICSTGETGGGQSHGGSGICPGVPLGQLVRMAREADPHPGTTVPHTVTTAPHSVSQPLTQGHSPSLEITAPHPRPCSSCYRQRRDSPAQAAASGDDGGGSSSLTALLSPIAGDVASPSFPAGFSTGKEGRHHPAAAAVPNWQEQGASPEGLGQNISLRTGP